MVDEPEQPAPPINRAARVALAFAVAGLLLGSVNRLGAGVGLVGVAFGIWGVLEGEKTETGIPTALFAIVIGLLSVLWAATSFVSG